jgi:uncharacterized protein YutE (UPF0331/DUF86 family)
LRPGIARRVDRLLKALERLDKLSQASLEELERHDLLPLLEREVEVTIQTLLDIGSYIISSSGWEPPASYGEIGSILSKHGVLEEGDGERLSRLAGLRDVIVHAYADIDYRLLKEHAFRLREDARRILESMVNYMRERGLDP